VQATPAAPQVGPVRLGPEVTKAEIPSSSRIATVEGAVAAFSPSTFGELLDATLTI
jgi:hypothetical protein